MLSCFWTSDVSHAVERCLVVCRRKVTFLVDVNGDNLCACGSDGTTVVCSSGGVAKELMSNESRLLDFLAAARNSNGILQRKTIATCASIQMWNPRAVGHCEEFDLALVQDGGEDFIDKWESMTSFRDLMLRKKGAVLSAPSGSQSTRGPMTHLSYVLGGLRQEFRGRCGDKHEYFSETPDLALVNAVIAHAARLAESEDIVVTVFDVRRAYFYAEEKRDTFVELPDVRNSPSCSVVGR